MQVDGKILIGGAFTNFNGTARNYLARINADGSLDTGFNPNADSYVNGLAVQADGKILLVGDFTTVSGTTRNRIARINANGSLDTGFNPNANGGINNGGINCVTVQADGKILVGGGFTAIGGIGRNLIARLNANGSLDTGGRCPRMRSKRKACGGSSMRPCS